jgi:hypothetical protein
MCCRGLILSTATYIYVCVQRFQRIKKMADNAWLPFLFFVYRLGSSASLARRSLCRKFSKRYCDNVRVGVALLLALATCMHAQT